METKKFTGIVKNGRPHEYWALCDQLPVAAFGDSFNAAIRNVIESIEQYQEATNGTPLKAVRLDRDEKALAFEVTVALP